ncbi:hypothetical protein JOD82_002003 [Paenibacillus sp. 1182]|nr:hypothetical protein [Paenibacillus sp. 1182]
MSVNYYFKDLKVQQAKIELEQAISAMKTTDLLFIEKATLPSTVRVLNEVKELHIGQYAFGTLLLKRNELFYSSVPEMKEFYTKNQDRLIIENEYGVVYTWEEFEKDVLSDPPRHGNFIQDAQGYVWI